MKVTMSPIYRFSSTNLKQGGLIALCAIIGSQACAEDRDLRLVPEIMIGTAGFEAGFAVELRGLNMPKLAVRPEAFINEDGRVGVGGSVLYDVSVGMDLPSRHAFAIGPRVVYHNSDDSGWEADALATWSYELADNTSSWHPAVGLLGALGMYHDKRHDDEDVGATIGVFYSFNF